MGEERTIKCSNCGIRNREAEARAEQAERERDEAREQWLDTSSKEFRDRAEQAEARAENLEVRVEGLTRALEGIADEAGRIEISSRVPTREEYDAFIDLVTKAGDRARAALAETSPPEEQEVSGADLTIAQASVRLANARSGSPPPARAEECPTCGSITPTICKRRHGRNLSSHSWGIDTLCCPDPFHSPPESVSAERVEARIREWLDDDRKWDGATRADRALRDEVASLLPPKSETG